MITFKGTVHSPYAFTHNIMTTYDQENPNRGIVRAHLNGFNICPTFIQQTLNGCWANVGQKYY